MDLKKTNLFFHKSLFYYWIPLFFWSGMIFLFSSIPGSGVAKFNWLIFFERKSAHIFEYFVLTILWIRVFWLIHKDENNLSYFWAILAAFVWAIFDEIHQIFVFGRSGKPQDFLIDLIGILLAVWFFQKIKSWQKNKLKRNKSKKNKLKGY